ncbi:MAG: 30S ribosomal protein S12 methylthiotransferase RimO [Bacteroidales bacterium]|nr:30S ribosomal protein S12 methylthiotransferase RimO [Bacteroidales bacterium]
MISSATRQPRHIGVISLGCAKTLVDSEELIRQLEFNEFQVTFEPATGLLLDAVIINTCGFIADAREESVQTILEYTQAKNRGEVRQLIVMGCLAQRYRQELKQEIPEADAIFGVDQIPEIVRFLDGESRYPLFPSRRLTTPSHYAYLKIAEGCDRTCSFCAIPSIRGQHRSRSMEEIVSEAGSLRQQGVKELILISQDTTYYGIDLYGRKEIATLMRRIAETSEMQWIRLHYTHPHAFPHELIDVMREYPTICKYIDIPLQHISDPLLKSMKRGIDSNGTRRLLDTIREKLPGVTIRTTFITGYPGEKESHFRELCRFLMEMQFERVGIFGYSHEENTPAYSLRHTIPEKTILERKNELLTIQESISLNHNLNKVGSEMTVLIDRREGKFWIARSEGDSPEVDQEVLIPVEEAQHFSPGSFGRVIITGAEPFDLIARPGE